MIEQKQTATIRVYIGGCTGLVISMIINRIVKTLKNHSLMISIHI